ncbi:MAG: hypothetical protein MJZ89_06540 [Paludibacteraceae bacterium]|nr:hypothetical protein [Paludibacteraceae bacterium]
MKLTSKQRDIILMGSHLVLVAIITFALWYIDKYHTDNWWWIAGLGVLEIFLLVMVLNVVPNLFDMRVQNQHAWAYANERLEINGKEKVWKLVGIQIMDILLGGLVFATMQWAQSGRHIFLSTIFFETMMTILTSPLLADQIHRCLKNTYTIEGSNLIIEEWAWFKKKTDRLVVPINEIQSIRKTAGGWVQLCNIEFEVAGIKRKLTSGMIGEELYNGLKERMQ